MRRAVSILAFLVVFLPPPAATSQSPGRSGLSDVLPDGGLITASVVAIRDQTALNAHYYLADEAVLGLGPKTEAVFARYRSGAGEALLLIVAYPSATEAGRVYERFGQDFFAEAFHPRSPRIVEKIETGDWAGAAAKGPFLIVVLEAPDRMACDGLLRRVEKEVHLSKAK